MAAVEDNAAGPEVGLTARIADLQATLEAIRAGGVDAVIVSGPRGQQVYTLASADRPYRVIVDSMVEGAVTISAHGVVLYVNRCLSEMMGRPPEALVGRDARELVVDENEPCIDAVLAMQPGESVRMEARLAGTAGEVPVLLASSCLSIDDVVIHCVVATDLSSQKAMERILEERVQLRTRELEQANSRLREANAELEAFGYSISHDLRGPLRAIHGHSQELLTREARVLSADGRRRLERVRANSLTLSRLIDDLLMLSRVGRAELQTERVDMLRMAVGALDDLREQGDLGGVEVSVGDVPEALADAVMVRQVWANLLSNAVKFSQGRPGARVTVEGESGEDQNVYRVRDNGVGFDMAYAGKLFGVFQRLHGPEFPGTGIGLAIVKRIVNRLGGKVWGEGEVGKGACFSFTLPATRSIHRASAQVNIGGERPAEPVSVGGGHAG